MTARTCPTCGGSLPSDAPEGNCPACLMRLAVADNSAQTGVTLTHEGPDASRSTLHVSAPPPSAFTQSPFVPHSLGDYELLEEIARGGMGIVYKARQKSLNRVVAVKLLLFGELSSEAFIQRFRVEAQAAASLKHPNIVSVYEIGQEAGQHYFSMEYVEGQNLAQLVRDKPLSAKKAAAYVKTIAEAIQSAHEKGILHRDLKPSNVLVDAEDRVRVTDFGLAKRFVPDAGYQMLDAGPSSHDQAASIQHRVSSIPDLTVTGQVLGTPNYLSPEQALARKEVGAATDVYALGGILYYLLTAHPPFQAETLAETLQQVVNAEPVSPRLLNASVPVDLETICLKCLEKESARRYSTAHEVAAELGRFLRDEPIQARPVSRAERTWRWCRRKPVLASLSAATVLLVLTVAIGSTLAALRIGRANREIRGRERDLRQNLYVADMKVASVALDEFNLGLAASLIHKYGVPKSGEEDLRGFEWRYLWKLCQGDETATLRGHARDVTCVAFSRDGRTLATASFDKTVRIWAVVSKQLLHTLGPFTNVIAMYSLTFSPDGRLLAVRDGSEITIWETGLWRKLSQFETDERLMNSTLTVAFSPDGKTLATASAGGVGFWDASSWEFRERIRSSDNSLGWRLAYTPDGRFLAVATRDQVQLWDVHLRSWVPHWEHPFQALRSLAASTNLLIAGNAYGGMTIWDIATGREVTTEKPHRSIVHGIAFSPDEQMLATSSADQRISVWDIRSLQTNAHGASALKNLKTLRGHFDQIRALAFSPDGKLLASGSGDETAKLWNVDSKLEDRELIDSWHPLWFSADGHRLITLNNDQTLHEWDVANRRVTRRIELVADAPGSATRVISRADGLGYDLAVAISSDAKTFAVGMDSVGLTTQTVEIWDLATTQRGAVVPLSGFGPRRIVISPHNRLLAVASSTDVKVFDLASRQEQASFRDCTSPVAAFSPDEELLATTGPENTIVLRKLSSPQELALLQGHKSLVRAVAFSPDGTLLASAARESTVRVWHVPSGRRLHELKGHITFVQGIAFSPEGRTLATGATDGTIILWNVATGQELLTLTRPGLMVGSLMFAPSGDMLAAGVLREYGARGPAELWRAPSIEEIAALEQIRQAEQNK